jgi:hypothetical protein
MECLEAEILVMILLVRYTVSNRGNWVEACLMAEIIQKPINLTGSL